MRSYLFLVFLFASSTFANVIAGKWLLLFMYQLYRYEFDAYGPGQTITGWACDKNGGVCDLETFAKQVCSKITNNPLPNGQPPKSPYTPDWRATDWRAIGDGATLNLATFDAEMTKAGFEGHLDAGTLFSDWNNKPETFNNIMNSAENIALATQQQYKNNPALGPANNARFQAMLKALEIHADARRCDQAININKAFTEFATDPSRNYRVVYDGNRISKPYVPSYQKVDASETVKANKLTDANARAVLDWAKNQNYAGSATKIHWNAIFKAGDVRKTLITSCPK